MQSAALGSRKRIVMNNMYTYFMSQTVAEARSKYEDKQPSDIATSTTGRFVATAWEASREADPRRV
jgi:hypothetical protein